MYNWSTDEKKITDPEQRAIWKLEQLINFGLGKEKIRESELRAYWQKLHLDPERKKFLEVLLQS